ncbi:MAG: hypothetical protein AB1896_03935 [Thermodesulfobacteriota bacterium]
MIKLVLLGTVHRDPVGKNRLLRALDRIRPSAISLEVSPASVKLRDKWGPGWMKLFRRHLAGLARETGLRPSRLMAGAGLRGVFEYLRLPFEYRAAMAYARENSCPVFLLDDSEIAAAYLSQVEEEILNARNIKLLHQSGAGEPLLQEVAENYARAAALVFPKGLGPVLGETWLKDPESWAQREAGLSQKLRLLHQGLVRRQDRTMKGEELVAGLIIAPEAVGFVPETISLAAATVHLYIGGWEHLIEDEKGGSLYSRLKDLKPERQLCFNHGGGN